MNVMFEVHNQLGPGFTEDIYENAVVHELETRKIHFKKQQIVHIYYKEKLVGDYRLDLVVADEIILELKAVQEILEVHKSQVLSYLKATHLRLGLLINFGSKKVESYRILN